MQYTVSAQAAANIANQPTYDCGGFAVDVIETIAGESADWESLKDKVTLVCNDQKKDGLITIHNEVLEPNVGQLPTNPDEHTAGKMLQLCIDHMKAHGTEFAYNLDVTVKKGISIRGTGLGSSGATPAAALRAFEQLLDMMSIDYVFSDQDKASMLMMADFGVPDNSVPAYFGGLTVVTVKGNDVDVQKVQKNENFGYFVACTPYGFGIKTADARAVLQGKAPSDHNDVYIQKMIECLEQGQTEEYGKIMEEVHNWFVGPRSRLYPEDGGVYDFVYESAKKAGSCGTTIGGAGPTMLAVAQTLEDAQNIGRAMHSAFSQKGFESVARITEISHTGATVLQSENMTIETHS